MSTYLPVKFLTTQKSTAHSEITMMKQKVLSSIIIPNSRNESSASTLKVRWRIQNPGWADSYKNFGTYPLFPLPPSTSASFEFAFLLLPMDWTFYWSGSDSISILKSRSSCIFPVFFYLKLIISNQLI